MLALTLITGLCVAARNGDLQHNQPTHQTEPGEPVIAPAADVGLTHPITINSREGTPMNISDTHALTQQQSRRIQTLPKGHTVISAQTHKLIVRRPDGRLARIRPSGRLVAANPVESVQSYLHLHG
jgi:hypothetical protein